MVRAQFFTCLTLENANSTFERIDDEIEKGAQMQTVSDSCHENELELKAYIYQYLVDLQPYLAPESQVAVLVVGDFKRHRLFL